MRILVQDTDPPLPPLTKQPVQPGAVSHFKEVNQLLSRLDRFVDAGTMDLVHWMSGAN